MNLLIVDDEPLVQIGLTSMLNWEHYNIQICAIASNGEDALKKIEQYKPELVISDIKMPIMDGLELIKVCHDKFGEIPIFILLTSYEDFSFVRKALHYGVSEYLLKMELTPEILETAVKNALQRIKKTKDPSITPIFNVREYHDKFFIRLLHNLFETQQQFMIQQKELGLNFSSDAYLCAYCEILEHLNNDIASSEKVDLYTSTIQMANDMLNKHLPCYTPSLDLKHFCIIFCLSQEQYVNYKAFIGNILQTIAKSLHHYFNVALSIGVGTPYTSYSSITNSYQEAQQIISHATDSKKLLFYEDLVDEVPKEPSFHISMLKEDLKKAFEEYDTNALTSIIEKIITKFYTYPTKYTQMMDVASSILYLAISLLPDGISSLSQIFSDNVDSYHSLYNQSSVEQIAIWLTTLSQGLCDIFETEKKNYKKNTITQVQKYINAHIDHKLTLNEVADVFGLSPNYLSSLFKKNCEYGFSEYINFHKIQHAKKLLQEGNYKIYEIAEQLGFENAFYFSKVFKKVEGCSPRDYISSKS